MKKNAKQKTLDETKAIEVKTQIANHREIDSSEIAVKVTNGHVNLSGDIDNGRAKNLVTQIVSSETTGVKSVTNDINFRRDISEAVTVEEISDVPVIPEP